MIKRTFRENQNSNQNLHTTPVYVNSKLNEKSQYFYELEKKKIKNKNKLEVIKSMQLYDDIILKEK